jgi:2'-5' RNA ligase
VGVHEETGTLKRLQKAVEDGMEKLGFPPEGREFHAHLTLGRTQQRASSGDMRRLSQLVEETNIGELGQMEARVVSLMRSDLRPTGAVYTQLAAVELEGK